MMPPLRGAPPDWSPAQVQEHRDRQVRRLREVAQVVGFLLLVLAAATVGEGLALLVAALVLIYLANF